MLVNCTRALTSDNVGMKMLKNFGLLHLLSFESAPIVSLGPDSQCTFFAEIGENEMLCI